MEPRGVGRLVALGALAALAASACGSTGAAAAVVDRVAPAITGPITTVPPAPPTGAAPAELTGTGAGWPEAFCDAAHTGTAATVGPQSDTVRWSRQLGAPISGGPAVSPGGTVYVSADDGVLHALDPETGADEWTFDGGGTSDNGQDLSTTPAVLADGTILWPGPKSTLYALDPAGHLEWTEPLRGTVLSPAVTRTGKVYVADSSGDLVALSPTATSPGRRWEVSLGTTSFGSPAVGPGGTVYGTADDSLVAVTDDGSHGVVQWRFTAHAPIEVSPAVGPDGTVVVGTNDGYEYGVHPGGSVAWRYPVKVYSYSSPVVTPDGLAYFGDNDGYLDVASASTGAPVGRYDGAFRALSPDGVGVWTAPLVDSHHDVYFGTASGHILGFSYAGATLFDLSTGATVDSYPALTANGTLLIGSDNGLLYAVG